MLTNTLSASAYYPWRGTLTEFLLKYVHTKPTHPQLTLHKHREIKYGTKHQPIPAEDTRLTLDTVGVKIIQQIIVSRLCYAGAVDNKLLVALSAVGSRQE